MSEREIVLHSFISVSFIFSSSCALFSTLSHPLALLFCLCHLFHPSCGHIAIFSVLVSCWLDYTDYGLYLEGNSSHSAVSGQMAEGLCSPKQMFPCLICTCFHAHGSRKRPHISKLTNIIDRFIMQTLFL